MSISQDKELGKETDSYLLCDPWQCINPSNPQVLFYEREIIIVKWLADACHEAKPQETTAIITAVGIVTSLFYYGLTVLFLLC